MLWYIARHNASKLQGSWHFKEWQERTLKVEQLKKPLMVWCNLTTSSGRQYCRDISSPCTCKPGVKWSDCMSVIVVVITEITRSTSKKLFFYTETRGNCYEPYGASRCPLPSHQPFVSMHTLELNLHTYVRQKLGLQGEAKVAKCQLHSCIRSLSIRQKETESKAVKCMQWGICSREHLTLSVCSWPQVQLTGQAI